MEYRKLGGTDLSVSVICLGTMTWGQQNDEADAHAQLDRALAAGVNFLDTAEMYAFPASRETQGETERIIGNWLASRGGRERMVIATKVIGPASDWLPWIRGGTARLDRTNIRKAIEQSLKRLRTDYVDLYQVHWPERATNYFGALEYRHDPGRDGTPVHETLQALGELVTEGKVRHLGISNETPWGTMRYLEAARELDLPRIVSIQNPYNLLNRTFEIGASEIAHRERVDLLAYSPLAFGALSGKYLGGLKPPGARLTLYPQFARYSNAPGIAATAAYARLAEEHGLSLAQMALAFVNGRPFLASNIIGATSLAQLDENLGSADLTLPEDVLEGIEAIHRQHPNPCP